jgi:hypothetical protein
MAVFEFDSSYYLGKVREVDTRKVSLQVGKDEDLCKANVGRLAALKLAGAVEAWLIGIIDKVIKTTGYREKEEITDGEKTGITGDAVINTVCLTLVGTVKWDAKNSKKTFSRSVAQAPGIDAECFVLQHEQLEIFMRILSGEGKKANSLEFGKYSMDESATALRMAINCSSAMRRCSAAPVQENPGLWPLYWNKRKTSLQPAWSYSIFTVNIRNLVMQGICEYPDRKNSTKHQMAYYICRTGF